MDHVDYEGTSFQILLRCSSLLSLSSNVARPCVTLENFRKTLDQITETIRTQEEENFKKNCARKRENSGNLLPINSNHLSETQFCGFVTNLLESWQHLKVGLLRFLMKENHLRRIYFC